MDYIYVDANVYVNYFNDERDRWRPLGEWAADLFNRVHNGEFGLIISDFLIHEIIKDDKVPFDVLEDFLSEFENKKLLKRVKKTREDEAKAKSIQPNHYQDPLHAILAKKHGAKYLITRDLPGFTEECRKGIWICYPESLP